MNAVIRQCPHLAGAIIGVCAVREKAIDLRAVHDPFVAIRRHGGAEDVFVTHAVAENELHLMPKAVAIRQRDDDVFGGYRYELVEEGVRVVCVLDDIEGGHAVESFSDVEFQEIADVISVAVDVYPGVCNGRAQMIAQHRISATDIKDGTDTHRTNELRGFANAVHARSLRHPAALGAAYRKVESLTKELEEAKAKLPKKKAAQTAQA